MSARCLFTGGEKSVVCLQMACAETAGFGGLSKEICKVSANKQSKSAKKEVFMENKEAITTLNAIKFLLDNDQYTDDVESALDTAITALEQQEKAFDEWCTDCKEYDKDRHCCPRFNKVIRGALDEVKQQGWIPCSERLPSAQPEQRYTEEELRVFQHGISLSLLSKRSSQHWQYDEDTATEIKFLERLYEKVVADMRGEQDGRFNQQTGGD